MKLEIGRTIRFIESRENGIELIKEFLEGCKLIKEGQKESREYYIYKSIKKVEYYSAELFFDKYSQCGYIRIEKIA